MKIILSLFVIFASFLGASSKVIGFAQDTMNNDFRVAQVRHMEEALKDKEGIKFVYKNASGSTALQLNHIEQLIEEKVDVIITSPRDSKLTTLVAKKVKEANIPLILITRGIESDDYTVFIRPDDYKIGYKAGLFLAKEIGYKGTILMLKGVQTATTTTLRTSGFKDAIKGYPDIKVISEVGNFLRSDAIIAIDKLHNDNIRYDAIYAQSDSMAIGAIMALEAKGIDIKNLPIVGIDFISESKGLIKSGKLRATYKYATSGYEGAMVALDIINGKKVEKDIIIPTVEITKENVDKVKPVF